MADNPASESSGNGAGNGPAEGGSRQFALRHLYVKDISFEAPNSPAIFSEGRLEPEIKLNLRTSHRDLGNDLSEVVLHMSVHALAGQRTMFLVELEQAGTFLVRGFPPDEARTIIGIACPNTLFPYARESISSTVQRGGFAQILLQPIDFTALYARAQGQDQARSSPPASGPSGKA
jgi:preprotein translocase subunit SecB